MINSYFKSAIFFVTFLSISFSTVGGTIALQGILRDPNGTTVTDGFYSLTIKLYEEVTGGTPVFTEVIGSAAVQNGVFSIEIGATSASSSALDLVPFNTTYYVGVRVDSRDIDSETSLDEGEEFSFNYKVNIPFIAPPGNYDV